MSYTTTELQAYKRATKLLAKMKSPGWEIRVWENLGWHYGLTNGPVSLSVGCDTPGEESYFCLIDSKPKTFGGCGLAYWTAPSGKGHFKNPNKAVKFAVDYMETVVTQSNIILALAKAARS